MDTLQQVWQSRIYGTTFGTPNWLKPLREEVISSQQGGIDTVRTLMDREALGGFYPPFIDGNGRPVPGGRVGKIQLGNILPGK